MQLREPDRELIWVWDPRTGHTLEPNRPVEREVFMVCYILGSLKNPRCSYTARSFMQVVFATRESKCLEVVVSLTASRVVSLTHIPNVQPAYTPQDYADCERLVKTSAPMREALARRGGECWSLLCVVTCV